MSKQDERRAAQLFDEYLTAAMARRDPDKQRLLDRCPRSQADALRLAMEGMEYVICNYYQTTVRPDILNAFLDGIRADQERERRLKEFRQSVTASAPYRVQELVAKMTDYLNRTASISQADGGVSLSGQAAVAGVFNRK